MNSVRAFRSQLSALNVPKSATPSLAVRVSSSEWKEVFTAATPILSSLVKAGSVSVLGPGDATDPEGSLRNHVNEDLATYIKVVGLIDIKLEIDRLKKR